MECIEESGPQIKIRYEEDREGRDGSLIKVHLRDMLSLRHACETIRVVRAFRAPFVY